MVDTNESILKILNVVETESKKTTPELSEINWKRLHMELEALQQQELIVNILFLDRILMKHIESICSLESDLLCVYFSRNLTFFSITQKKVHTFQRLLQDEETPFTCALLLYHFSLVKSVTNLIRRPGRFISNSKLLEIDHEIGLMSSTDEKNNKYPWWAPYFLFTKKVKFD